MPDLADRARELLARALVRLPAPRLETALCERLERRWVAGGRVSRLRRLRDLRVERYRQRAAARPGGLEAFEHRVRSQNGEDGILEEVFRRLGPGGRRFVEFGSGDGSENCTRHLLEAHGWSGVWIEGSAGAAARAASAFASLPLRVLGRTLTADRLLGVLAEAEVEAEPDLVVIDVDGNDSWMWRALARRHRPRVLVIEVNSSYPPGVAWVMPYRAEHVWRGTRWHGASLESLVALGGELGYRLVACDTRGVNAFFVRADLAAPFPGGSSAADHYWPPLHHPLFFGHPPHVEPPPPMEPLPAEAERQIAVELEADGARRLAAGERSFVRARIRNRSGHVLSAAGRHPVCLSYHWLDASGAVALFEGLRTPLLRPIPPGTAAGHDVEVEAPAAPGRYRLQVRAVQEGVRWLERGGSDASVEVE